MYGKPIPSIPASTGRNLRANNYSLKNFLLDFYDSMDDCIEVVYDSDEYTSCYSLFSGLRKAIAVMDLPIEAIMRHSTIYLRKM